MNYQSLADRSGATKRQIKLWTDGGILQVRHGDVHRGRGKVRHYAPDEVPLARLCNRLANLGLPGDRLKEFAVMYRELIKGPTPLDGAVIVWRPDYEHMRVTYDDKIQVSRVGLSAAVVLPWD